MSNTSLPAKPIIENNVNNQVAEQSKTPEKPLFNATIIKISNAICIANLQLFALYLIGLFISGFTFFQTFSSIEKILSFLKSSDTIPSPYGHQVKWIVFLLTCFFIGGMSIIAILIYSVNRIKTKYLNLILALGSFNELKDVLKEANGEVTFEYRAYLKNILDSINVLISKE